MGKPLKITFPKWTIYGGENGWAGAAFNPAGDLMYLQMEVDQGPIILYQIAIPENPHFLTRPLRIISQVTYEYEYSHNLIASNQWLYTDTNDATISRWKLS